MYFCVFSSVFLIFVFLVLAKRLAGKSISETTFLCWFICKTLTRSINSISHVLRPNLNCCLLASSLVFEFILHGCFRSMIHFGECGALSELFSVDCRMPALAVRLARLLKPGGVIVFRDYGRYDLTQLRFKKGVAGCCVFRDVYVNSAFNVVHPCLTTAACISFTLVVLSVQLWLIGYILRESNEKCIVVTRVCVCLCDCPWPHAHTIARTRM